MSIDTGLVPSGLYNSDSKRGIQCRDTAILYLDFIVSNLL